jgi:hypothetical protein
MKLFLFGDSFGSFTRRSNTKLDMSKTADENTSWWLQLQKKLGCEKTVNFCLAGTSLDAIQWKFELELPNISKEDYIVIIHTEPSRRWFIKECPGLTNFQNFINFPTGEIRWDWIEFMTENHDYDKDKIKRQVQVARDYCLFVANKEMEALYGSAISSYFYKCQIKGYKLINIPAYNIPTVDDWNVGFATTGSLVDIADYEFVPMDNDYMKAFTTITKGMDGRIGHLSKVNHNILVDKIYNSLTRNADLLLEQDFKQEFITADNWDEYNDYGLTVGSYKGQVKERPLGAKFLEKFKKDTK